MGHNDSVVAAASEFRVLVTGFGPFLDVALNPTGAVIERGLLERAHRRRHGVHVDYRVLPVVHPVGPALEAPDRYDLVIHLGVGHGSSLRVECGATNEFVDPTTQTATPLDASKARTDFLSAALPNTLPTQAGTFDVVVGKRGDAGSYVCNETLYVELDRGVDAIFIHVPDVGDEGLEALAAALAELCADIIASKFRR